MNYALRAQEISLDSKLRNITYALWATDDEEELKNLQMQRREIELELSRVRLELYCA